MNDNVMYLIFKKCDLKTQVNIKKSCQRYNAIFVINNIPIYRVSVSKCIPNYKVPHKYYIFTHKNKALEYAHQLLSKFEFDRIPEYNEFGKYSGYSGFANKYNIDLKMKILNSDDDIISMWI